MARVARECAVYRHRSNTLSHRRPPLRTRPWRRPTSAWNSWRTFLRETRRTSVPKSCLILSTLRPVSISIFCNGTMPAVWSIWMSVSGGMPVLLQRRGASEIDSPPKVYTWRDDTDEFHFVRPHIDLLLPIRGFPRCVKRIDLFVIHFWKRVSTRMSLFDIGIHDF